MMHKAWSRIEEVPYCFSRSYVKFQGHTALKFVKFDPNWAFSDCDFSLNSPMAMKCCTKLETAKERCPIVFQGHPSNFKVTQNITDFDPNWAFPDCRPVAAFKSLRFALFFYLRSNKRLSKQWRGWWFEMQLCPSRRHRNEVSLRCTDHAYKTMYSFCSWKRSRECTVSISFAPRGGLWQAWNCRSCRDEVNWDQIGRYYDLFMPGYKTIGGRKLHNRCRLWKR